MRRCGECEFLTTTTLGPKTELSWAQFLGARNEPEE